MDCAVAPEEMSRFRIFAGRWQFLNDNGEWVNVRLGTASRYAQSGDGTNWIYQEVHGTARGGMNIIPTHNNLFTFYVEKMMNEFCRLVLNKPQTKNIDDIIKYIFQNWAAF